MDYRQYPISNSADNNIIASVVNEMMNLGFIPSEKMFSTMSIGSVDLIKFYEEVIPALQRLVGAHVDHKPMYPNFPKQVAELNDFEWQFNAIVHYISDGKWLPQYEKEMRSIGLESNVKYKIIDFDDESVLYDKINNMAYSPDSLTAFDKEAIQWCIDEDEFNFDKADKIIFAETRCIILAELMSRQQTGDFCKVLNNMTDILRVATYISGGDVSLAKNCKFKNFARPDRRFLTSMLEIFWDDETASRHKNKWVKLLHSLHVGDYSDKVWEKAKKLRENIHIETFNGNVEAFLKKKDIKGAINLLKQRPSEFARRLDHLLRSTDTQAVILNKFNNVISEIPTKILIQLAGHLEHRTTERKSVVIPKGQTANAVLIDQKGEIPESSLKIALAFINSEMLNRFEKLSEIEGKVWIDPDLKKCPVPSGMRSITDGLITVPRGTQFNFGDDNTIRLFVYWIGQDIDLSATFHDENFKMISHVSYTRLRNGDLKTYHSGDITTAPNGASEFIDVDVDIAAKKARYLAMNVFVYSGPNFNDHEECFVGWMGRNEPDANEIYEPKTVKHCLNLVNETRYVCPLVFDLVERKVIFVDMTKQEQNHYGGHNVESNAAGIKDILYSIVNSSKMSLYNLFENHAIVRSEGIVDTKEEADFTFGIEDCDMNVTDWQEIQTDYMS